MEGSTYPLLALSADVLDDLERVRIANENRLRQLTRTEADSDGEVRGFGLPLDHPDVARLVAIVDMLRLIEGDAVRSLQLQMKLNPLNRWAQTQRGIGLKQIGRLLATIGNPYIRPEIVREDGTVVPEGPRSLSSLYAYCGLMVDETGIAIRRRKGVKSNWSNLAKMRVYLIAEACLKQLRSPCVKAEGNSYATHEENCVCSPYRKVYDVARMRYAEATHQVECIRCGPRGKPAAVGSPLSDGHKHMRAMRAIMKEVLKNLYLEAKRIHDEDFLKSQASLEV